MGLSTDNWVDNWFDNATTCPCAGCKSYCKKNGLEWKGEIVDGDY